jgi:hypothetical protein
MNTIKQLMGKDLSGIVFNYLTITQQEVKKLNMENIKMIRAIYYYSGYTSYFDFTPVTIKFVNERKWKFV